MYRPQTFQGTVAIVGGRAMIAVPFDPDRVWGPRGRPVAAGTVGGHPWRGPLERVGDGFALSLAPGDAARWAIGATIDVVLAAEDPQMDNVAPDVAAALAAEPEALAFFEGLAGYYRRNFIRGIEGAKRPATRAARIAEMMALLRQGRQEK